MVKSEAVKSFYSTYHDKIFEKRFNSPHPARRKVHRDMYDSILGRISPGMQVLDDGCGEGVLSILMAEKGAEVTAVDFSEPNILAAKAKAAEFGMGSKIDFQVGDAENLPFPDASFDYVVSNHVLEHLPSFRKGLQEIHRVVRKHAIVAVPTCLNPCAMALLGGDTYWKIGRRTHLGIPIGFARVLWALITGQEGVDEGYGGSEDTIHVFRFPWVVNRMIKEAGFTILDFRAQSIRAPYIGTDFNFMSSIPVFRNFGIGTVYVLEK